MTEPKIRFKADDGGDFPDYQSYLFRDVARLERGSSPRPIQLFFTDKEDGVNWIKIGDVSEGEIHITKTEQKITPEGAKKSRKVHAGDIILSNSMSFGRPYILDIDGYIHDGWFVIRDYDKYFNRDYLCQFLGSDNIQMQYKRLSAGGVVSNISSDLVYSVNVCLPSLPEQQKIADFLSGLDDVISTSEEEVTNLEKQKKAVMQKIFSQEVRFKKEDGSDFPDWGNKTLVSMCDFISDGDWIESKDQSESGVRLIQTGNVGVGTFLNKEGKEKWISEETYERLRCKEVKPGTILVSRLPFPAGRACIVPDTGSKMITAVDCSIVCVNEEYCDGYIVQYLCSANYFKDVEAFLAGGTRQRISRGNLETIRVPIPSDKNEQQLIADFLAIYDEAIATAKQELEKWKELKKGLLQQMFV